MRIAIIGDSASIWMASQQTRDKRVRRRPSPTLASTRASYALRRQRSLDAGPFWPHLGSRPAGDAAAAGLRW
jgi:hypothetical protein